MKKTSSLVIQHLLWRGLYFFSVLLLNVLIARLFAAEKSGGIFYIVNNLALILLIVSISLESGSTYYIASGKLEAPPMAYFSEIWAVGASLIALIGWWVFLYLSHSHYFFEPGFVPACFLFILGTLFTTYFTALFYARKEFGLPNKILFLVNLLLIIILLAGRNHAAIRSHFIEIYFFSFFLQGLLLRIFFFRKTPFAGKSMLPPGAILKKVIRFSLVALMANGVYFLVNRVDYWFVKYFCSEKDLGNYIQASKLAQMLVILPGILGATLFPIFSSGDKTGNEAQLTASVRILLWINGTICLLILSFGWFAIPFIFGSSFDNLYFLFVLLIPGVLCITMNYPLSAWFSAANRIRINIRGSVLALILICIGDFIALPRYGIMAAPIIGSAGYFCYYCYTVSIYRKEHSVRWKDLLLIRKSDLNRIRQSVGRNFQEIVPENPIV